jgi:hypothetical protein
MDGPRNRKGIRYVCAIEKKYSLCWRDTVGLQKSQLILIGWLFVYRNIDKML